ncbi:hypothetical protein AU458_RS02185 [Escherichia coli]|nr:hypothetical protein [Escherichia coli]TZC61936.1 hypothetical protein E0J33_13310 [Escherichia coli]
MKNVTQEKILYLAKYNGGFNIISREYSGNLAKLIDSLLEFDFIKWETNELWYEYAGQKWESDYDNAIHSYTITKAGEVRLAIMRCAYTYKNHKGEEKHIRRNEELLLLMEAAKVTMHDLFHHPRWYENLTKAEYKALRYIDEQNNTVQQEHADDGELSIRNVFETTNTESITEISVQMAIKAMELFKTQYDGVNSDEVEREFITRVQIALHKSKK